MADLSAGEKQRAAPGIQIRGLNWILLTHFMLVDGWFCSAGQCSENTARGKAEPTQ